MQGPSLTRLHLELCDCAGAIADKTTFRAVCTVQGPSLTRLHLELCDCAGAIADKTTFRVV